ncbi:MAG: DMT family transporter [Zoogloeaceae bacterium]|jgi:drug/metabolite transporter (DMT)-like permease|nr:DMT family transporter [Zoogloeaceae bacterium]
MDDPKAHPAARFSPALLALLLAVALFWGLNWPVMKIAVQEIPPFGFRGFSLLLGGLGLLGIARARSPHYLPPQGKWRVLGWISLVNISAWNAFSIYAITLLPSGRAALLGYTMPVWSLLLSVLWLRETLTRRGIAGLALGALGIFFMLGAEIVALSGAPLGVVLMLVAAFSWALGIVSIKRFPIAMSSIAFSGWMMVLGGLPVALLSLLLEWSRWRLPGFWPAAGFFYNVFVTVMFCYWAWNYIVLRLPVAVSSLSSLLVPLIGVLGGMLLLGEKPGWGEALGTLCILGAVATVAFGRR